MAGKRSATVNRETGETKISVALSLDGTGKSVRHVKIRSIDELVARSEAIRSLLRDASLLGEKKTAE